MSGFLHLWWAGLTRRKVRLVLTLMSIIVAFFLFAFLFAVQRAFQVGAELAGNNRLNVTPRYSIIDPLPLAHMTQIESVPGVEAVAFSDWFGVTYQNRQNDFAVYAVDVERYLKLYPEYDIDPAVLQRALSKKNSAIVNDVLWKQQQESKYGWKEGNIIPINSYISTNKDGTQTWQVELAGVIKRKDGKPDPNGL
jgi:putative ABC transport system permease protein